MSNRPDSAAQAAFDAGLSRYRAADFAQAAQRFETAAALAPGFADARRMLGMARLRQNRPAEALSDLARAVALAPRQSVSHLHHGVGLLLQGRNARAAARFRRASLLAPDDPAPWINLSSALLALGKPGAARAAARRALRLAPDQPDALQALARGHLDMGDAPQAVATLRRLLKQHPQRSAAWLDLGLAQARQGAMGAASQAMKAALKADPNSVAAATNLAGFAVLTGDQTGAIRKLRELVAKHPASAPARLNLANALLLDRQAQAALQALDAPPPPGREGAHWRAQQALALLLLDRAAEAEAALDAIPTPYGDAEILIVNRRLQLARRAGDEASVAARSAELEALCGEPRFLFEHRILALFDLGRFRHERGEPARAFAHWRSGHDMLRRLQPFSRETHRAFIDASLTAFDADRLRNGARASNQDPAPVFIVGLPRSGTTLAEQILASHRDIHGAGERANLHDLIVARTGSALEAASARRLAGFGAAELDEMATAFLADLKAEAPDKRLIVDKMPANALHLGFIATLLPGAKIILCTRDPRDIGLSIFQLRFFGYHPYAHDLEDLAFYIAEHERLMQHWRMALPLPMLEIALTDWTDDFQGTLARALDFLRLPHDSACERFYENPRLVRTASAGQVRQPVNRRGIGRWRQYETELAPLLEALERFTPPPAEDALAGRRSVAGSTPDSSAPCGAR